MCTKLQYHTTPVLKRLHWLPVSHRIIFQILLLIYKSLNGFAPSHSSVLLNQRSYAHTLRSCSQEPLTVPR